MSSLRTHFVDCDAVDAANDCLHVSPPPVPNTRHFVDEKRLVGGMHSDEISVVFGELTTHLGAGSLVETLSNVREQFDFREHSFCFCLLTEPVGREGWVRGIDALRLPQCESLVNNLTGILQPESSFNGQSIMTVVPLLQRRKLR